MNPHPPYQASSTSKAGAESIADYAPTLRERVYDFVRERRGATRDEITVGTGISLQTVCARVDDLLKLGRLTDTQDTRKTSSGRKARVLVALVPEGGTQQALFSLELAHR